jgi:CRISPR-associated protein Cas2
MMHVLVMYDISNDRTRSKVIVACEDYGLDRVQFSAFYGKLARVHQRELMTRVNDLIKAQQERAVVQLVTIGEDDWKKRIEYKVDAE